MKKLLALIALSLMTMLYAFSPDYPVGLQIQDGAIVPEPVVIPAFQDDFNVPGAWEVANYENHAKMEYTTYKGMKGLMITNAMGKKGDTAWQIQAKTVAIPEGMDTYRLEIKVESSVRLNKIWKSPGYGSHIEWFDKDDKLIFSKTFTLDSTPGNMRYNIQYGEIPANATKARLTYGFDNPNIDVDEYIFLDYASLSFINSATAPRGKGYVVSTTLPLSEQNPRFNADVDIPDGCSVVFEYSTTISTNDTPDLNAWTPFKPVNVGDAIATPENAKWIRWKVSMTSTKTAHPTLRSVTIGKLTDKDWAQFTSAGTPYFKHISQTPTTNRNEPLKFLVGSDLPISFNKVKVALDGKPIAAVRNGNIYTIAAPAGGFTDGMHIVKCEAEAINGASAKSELWFWTGTPISGPNVTLRDDGMTLLDGKPYFPVGIYSISKRKFNNFNFDEAFRGLKAAGFNMAHTYTASTDPEFFAAAEKYGIKLFNHFNKMNNEIMTMLLRCKNIIAWYVGDDTSSHDTPENLMLTHDNLAAIDPSRICTQADGARGYDGFEKCTESYLPEIYPVRELGEAIARNCVAKVVSDMEKCFNNIKSQNAGPRSIWPIIQYMEGWTAWKRFPTETEVNAMSWAAIACGAHGITWYTYAPGSEKNHGAIYSPETWRIMTTLSMEISNLHDVLAERAIKLPQPVVVNGPDKNPLNRDSIVIIAKKHKEDTWVFAVNSVMDPVTANITIPGCKEIRWYKENRSATLKDGTFTEAFEPYGIRIFIAR